MREGQSLWTREEVIQVLYLYFSIPFRQTVKTNKEVIRVANLIGRTPSAVALKLGNLGSFDPVLQKDGISGAQNASKLDKQVWDEFNDDKEALLVEVERLNASLLIDPEPTILLNESEKPILGIDGTSLIKYRVNQSFFRKMILANYNGTCCITGLNQPELLIASHIIPWSQRPETRLLPENGLCLNYIHDRAFELGFLAINSKYQVLISSVIKKQSNDFLKTIISYEGKTIVKPDRALPNRLFLEEHRDTRFRL